MRVETMTGQYLDLATGGDPAADLDTALAIARHKTAAYTIDYPLRVGAALTGAGPGLLAALRAYAIPLGEAFQMRDDLLGVFGNPTQTGKPAVDDLREGKHTALLAVARRNPDPIQRALLGNLVGDPDLDTCDVERVRSLLTSTGARAAVEAMIAERCRQAIGALDIAPLDRAATVLLRELATAAVARPHPRTEARR